MNNFHSETIEVEKGTRKIYGRVSIYGNEWDASGRLKIYYETWSWKYPKIKQVYGGSSTAVPRTVENASKKNYLEDLKYYMEKASIASLENRWHPANK